MDRKPSSSSTTPSVRAMRNFYAPWVTQNRHGRGIVKGGAAVKVIIPSASAASTSSRPIRGQGRAAGVSRLEFSLSARAERTVPVSSKKDEIGIAILSPAVTSTSTSSLSSSGGKEEVVHTLETHVGGNEGCRRPMPLRQIHHLPSRSFFDGDDSVDSRERGHWWRKGLSSFIGIVDSNPATKPRQGSGRATGARPLHDSYRHYYLPPGPRLPRARRVVAAIKTRPLIVTIAEFGGALSLLVFLIVVMLFAKHHQQTDHDGQPRGEDTTPTSTTMTRGENANTTAIIASQSISPILNAPSSSFLSVIVTGNTRTGDVLVTTPQATLPLRESSHTPSTTWMITPTTRDSSPSQPQPPSPPASTPEGGGGSSTISPMSTFTSAQSDETPTPETTTTTTRPPSLLTTPPSTIPDPVGLNTNKIIIVGSRPPPSPPLQSSESSAPFGVPHPLRPLSTLPNLDHKETTVMTVTPTATTALAPSSGSSPPSSRSHLPYGPGQSA
ncbi:hypothetical protein PG985_001558 [Apiospora marii]|uniref:uncharacterized protein n=1 Tax=Apiospora marii TaxID=335849 RepID=UPI00312DBC24